MRVLKLWLVVNDTDLYELKEEQPIQVMKDELPIKITLKNGFHFSKTYFISKPVTSPLLIGIGCRMDNGRFGGCLFISIFLFAIFWTSSIYYFLIAANIPLLYVIYIFFLRPKEFITVEVLKGKLA